MVQPTVAMVSLAGVLAIGVASGARAQPFDHLQCHKVKDALGKGKFTADLMPAAPAFATPPGCEVKTPARLLCTDVAATNVVPAPPGAAPGPQATRVLCYKVKCARQAEFEASVGDRFGARTVEVKAPGMLCAPLSEQDVPTTTTSMPPPTTTTTTEPSAATSTQPSASTTTTSQAPASSTTTTTLPPAAGCPVVNEIMTGGTASGSEEFVEVLNRCAGVADLSGGRLVYRSAAGTSDLLLVAWPAGTVLPAGGRLVYGGAAFTGPRDGDLGVGLSGAGGGVAIRSAAGDIADSVGYGTASNAFVEGAAAPAPAPGGSIGRVPDGADTNQNASDWVPSSNPTPGAPNPGA